MKNILDVSRYQGIIDWDAVKASNLVNGVMLKTVSTNRSLSSRSDGLYIDPTFERNYAECQRVGLPVGVYY
ncbi:MAG: GH25 family lysozyme, partial [Faecalibacterium sp.]